MADTKITALAAITTVDPAADVLPIVDISDTSMAASGTTKKITSNQILGAGGTATLASATITGDLTVDTNVLKVNTTTNRVGINTTTPTQNLEITGSGNPLVADGCSAVRLNNTVSGRPAVVGVDDSQNFVIWNVGTEVSETIKFLTGGGNGKEQYRITHGGVFNWYDGAGGTRMTLNSTGLGVGGSPSYKLDVQGTSAGVLRLVNINNSSTDPAAVTRLSLDSQGATWHLDNERTNGIFKITRNSTACLTIDNSANLGIGVTPSAWISSWKAIDISTAGAGLVGTAAITNLTNNCFLNASAQWIYKGSFVASRYQQSGGEHQFYTAASGTAGNAITFTQAMTLDASGNLLVGKTASNSTVVGAELRPSGAIISTLAASTDADFALYTYSTGAGAARFYVGMSGTVFATNTTISAISDQRLKENVQDIDVGLGAILALKPRKFDWKEGKGKDIKGDRGFIAQEFEQVFPQLVDEWADPAPEGEAPYKSVRQDLIPVLVKAIQELTARVQTLETR